MMNVPPTRMSKPIAIILIIFVGSLVLCPPLSAETWVRVRWVDDGDTVVLEDGRRVRYIGINTPEIEHGKQPAEPFGNRARSFNIQLVLQKPVRLSFDRERRDHYGRMLAYVYLRDGSLVNQRLVQQGYAHVLYRPPNVAQHELLLKAQRKAMDQSAGIWENWREGKTAYLANRRSKRFHRMDCPYGKRTAAANQIVFDTAWQAFRQGYSPARKCLGSIGAFIRMER